MRGGNRAWSIREGVSYGIGERTGGNWGVAGGMGKCGIHQQIRILYVRGQGGVQGFGTRKGKFEKKWGCGTEKGKICGIGDGISSANSQKGGNLT